MATELSDTRTPQNIGLSKKNQSWKVTSIQFHVHDPLKRAKGAETRAVAARGWNGGLQEAQGNFEGDGIIYILIMKVVSWLKTLVKTQSSAPKKHMLLYVNYISINLT